MCFMLMVPYCYVKQTGCRLALYMRVIFLVFKAVSGLKVNLSKSTVFSVNAEDSIAEFAEILQCKIEAFPTSSIVR